MPIALVAAAGGGNTVSKVAGAIEGVAKAIGSIAGIHFGSSPRYAGGPLVSTVQGALAEVAAGNLATIQRLDQLRKTDKDKAAWQGVWDNLLPQVNPLSAEARAVIARLDPSKAFLLEGTSDYRMPAVTKDTPTLSGGPAPTAAAQLLQGNGWIWAVVALVVLFLILRK